METVTTGLYVTPFTFKSIPNSTLDIFLKARGEEREEDSHVADSGYFEKINSMCASSPQFY